MARIKVLEAIAGADFSWSPGDVIEVSVEEAAAWADGHRAVLADDGGEGPVKYAAEDRVPVVIGENGQTLEVVDAHVEGAEAPDGGDDGLSWSRWRVTVRLPVPAAEDDDQEPADPADLENEEPEEPPVPLFNPDEHSNKGVLAYLETVGEQEALRVLDAEAAGQNRAGIAKNRETVLEAARARDVAEGRMPPEVAADFSRGGGGAEAPETRDW
ncbi:hypothetical protein [Streptomyces sp. NBC_00582]|uniref:hypothetical protein n=1 Tax=Streptomyces sp. NBC_00582 TaxID=2975783 RepID=UPI002E81530E|nr:hypothetical protein [Streptomyces sp. NBC_00582]WUB64424.1 hypothetical protein OG852_30550 [Streptomyces sp. NBC_00582]